VEPEHEQQSEERRVMVAAALGWMGTIGTITAYLMLSRGRMSSDSLRYSSMNFVGGLLGASATALYGAWPSVVSNVIWAAVAGHSMFTILRSRDWRWAVGRLPYVTEIDEVDGAGAQPAEVVGLPEAPTAQAA
jgi:hypothetical protein